VEGLEAALCVAILQVQTGALGAAGNNLWGSLRDLVKKHTVRSGLPTLDDEPSQVSDVAALASILTQASSTDRELSLDLQDWISQIRAVHTSIDQSSVSNSVSGFVSGPVIQIGNLGERRNS
jgi:hypothetical protein